MEVNNIFRMAGIRTPSIRRVGHYFFGTLSKDQLQAAGLRKQQETLYAIQNMFDRYLFSKPSFLRDGT